LVRGIQLTRLLDFLIPDRENSTNDFRLRSQLPYLALTVFCLIIGYLCVLVGNYLIDGLDLFFMVIVISEFILAAAIVLLRRGEYRKTAYLTTLILLLVSLAALFFMKYSGNNSREIYRPLAFAAVMATINAVVALNIAQIVLFAGLYIPCWVISFFTIFRQYFSDNSRESLALLGVGVVALLIATISLYLIKSLSARMLDKAEEEAARAKASLEHLTRLLEDAKEGMDIGSRLLSATDEASRAVESIALIRDGLGEESSRLMDETGSLGDASQKMLASSEKMETSTLSQNAAITETSAALEEISQNIRSINAIATQRRGMLDEESKAGAEKRELIRKQRDAFDSLKESSKGISAFVRTVQDIASRTSLLSMNASIEAARAGAAGKGFAVVAQEIRALSGETQKNADLIKRMIDENDRTVGQTSSLVAEFSDFVTRGIERTQALIDSMDEISNGISEMDIGTSEVMKAIEQMVAGTQVSTDMVNEVVAQINVQHSGLDHFASFVKDLDSQIEALREAVAQIHASMDLIAEAGKLNIEQMGKLSEKA
jgi:methyl-accepting chemotaxis protein